MNKKKTASTQSQATVSNKKKTPNRLKIFNTLKLRHVLIGGGIGVLVFVGLLIISFGMFNLAHADKIYPRVYIGSLNTGGMTQEQARVQLAKVTQEFEQKKLIIKEEQGKSWTASPKELGFSPDINLSVKQAYNVGRNPNWFRGLIDLGEVLLEPVHLPVINSAKPDQVNSFIDGIANEIDQPEQDASLKVSKGTITEVKEKTGQRVDKPEIAKKVITALETLDSNTLVIKTQITQPKVYSEGLALAKESVKRFLASSLTLKFNSKDYKVGQADIERWISFSAGQRPVENGQGVYLEAQIDNDKLKDYLKKIAKEIDQPARDAKLTIKDGKAVIFASSQEGYGLDIDKTAQDIQNALAQGGEQTLELKVNVTKPQVSESAINDLGINELIGSATTSFVKSPENRIHNINIGAQFLNGRLVKPGETFSTIASLGSIDEAGGYLPELVIKDDKTQPEFGGGLCQVSTTLFRSVLNAGLPIVERQNHSWRISYYEPPVGLDATIYFPKPDFKFKNDTPGWILIQNKVEGTKITFELYGSKDGRVATVEGPTLLSSTPPGDDVYVDDPGLPAGEVKRIQTAHPGGSAIAQYKVVKDGKVINSQVFKSVYKAVPAQYTRGTGPVPEPTPEPPSDQPQT